MQHAKKLVVVDPKFLEQLQTDREYKQIQKPADALAKSSLSVDIGRILRDDTTPEDKKVKLYLDALRRFINVRSELPSEVKVESNPLQPPPPPEPEPKRHRKQHQSPPQVRSKRHRQRKAVRDTWQRPRISDCMLATGLFSIVKKIMYRFT